MYITLLFLNQYIARIVIIKPPSLKAMRILTITIVVNVAYLFCLLVYLFLPYSTILQWNFGTVRIVWYFLFQILWKSLWYVYEDLEKTCVAMGIYIYFLVLAGITLEWFFFQLWFSTNEDYCWLSVWLIHIQSYNSLLDLSNFVNKRNVWNKTA
jgi:hypothetical protein